MPGASFTPSGALGTTFHMHVPGLFEAAAAPSFAPLAIHTEGKEQTKKGPITRLWCAINAPCPSLKARGI